MKVNFDFYVGQASSSDESGSWFIATITKDCPHAQDLNELVGEDFTTAEEQLAEEMRVQGQEFLFIHSAGCNDATDYAEEESHPGEWGDDDD